jgi:hypothetical protein
MDIDKTILYEFINNIELNIKRKLFRIVQNNIPLSIEKKGYMTELIPLINTKKKQKLNLNFMSMHKKIQSSPFSNLSLYTKDSVPKIIKREEDFFR